jgi:hypothetical protein
MPTKGRAPTKGGVQQKGMLSSSPRRSLFVLPVSRRLRGSGPSCVWAVSRPSTRTERRSQKPNRQEGRRVAMPKERGRRNCVVLVTTSYGVIALRQALLRLQPKRRPSNSPDRQCLDGPGIAVVGHSAGFQ